MDWQLIEEGDTKYFQFKWQNFIAVYSTKYGEDNFLKKFDPLFIKQVHSNIIIDVDHSDKSTGDGLITSRKNLCLGIKVADCLPVYLFKEEKACIIHCGWRSIIKGIAKQAKALLCNYKYVFGASIDSCCYELKQDVIELFEKEYQDAIIVRNKKYYFDLKTAVTKDLGKENLIDSLNLCTKCHPEYFYSYRRGDNKKRNYAVIKLF